LAGSAAVTISAVDRHPDESAALGRFVSTLAAGTHDVRAGLAAALGRPDLEIAYWLPDEERWVDRGGAVVAIDETQPGVEMVFWRGERVAALRFDVPADEPLGHQGALASVAALALENERLHVALRARLEEEQALRRVATSVARQHAPEDVLGLVSREVARHLRGDSAMTARYDGPGLATVLAEWSAVGVKHFPAGRRVAIGGPTALAQVQRTSAPARVDTYEGMPGDYPAEVRELGVRASVAAPIVVDGRLWGAVAAASVSAPFPPDAEARLGAFAELVAQAVANVDARLKLDESRARIVEAADAARRKIERDLHDGAQQRLVSLAIALAMVARGAEPTTAEAVRACADELQAALAELRELARGIHPAVLTERGLVAAVEALAARSPVPVELDAQVDERLPSQVEAALYFVAAEALANIAKYARAAAARITLSSDGGAAQITIADDGVGGASIGAGSGLRGLADRLDALGGVLSVDSGAARGTTVRAVVPVARRR
jgi:signal transduction histidine kinase